MASSIVSSVIALIADLPTNGVLRERAAFLKEQAEAMEKRISELEDENGKLRNRLREAEQSIAEDFVAEDLVEHRGALFKRKTEGGYHRAVFCPVCQRSTSSLQKVLPYHCSTCRWAADFTGRELDEVMKELPS